MIAAWNAMRCMGSHEISLETRKKQKKTRQPPCRPGGAPAFVAGCRLPTCQPIPSAAPSPCALPVCRPTGSLNRPTKRAANETVLVVVVVVRYGSCLRSWAAFSPLDRCRCRGCMHDEARISMCTSTCGLRLVRVLRARIRHEQARQDHNWSYHVPCRV